MFEDSSNFAIALQFFTVVLATRWLLKSKATAAKKLHVDYGGDVSLPLPLKIIASLPDSIRIPLLVKLAKPSPPKDSIDILGTKEVDPYKKREILPGKIWGVKYTYITDPELGKFLEMFMEGTKEERKAAAIQNAPDHLRVILKEDFDRKEKYDALSDVEKAKLGGDSCQEMFVIKINADDILLYNPVRMHLEMIDWINQRGQVKYIVSGSSAHTNHLPGTAAAFPNAIIICASAADAKCQAVGMRPADYLYDLHEDEPLPKSNLHRGTMKHATDALDGQAKLFHVRGDVMTQSLLLLAHGHLFEVDLVYSSSDETKRESNFETGSSIIHSGRRLFTHAFVSEKVKPYGYTIPPYRCMFMDPSNIFAVKMSLNPPKEDGSSCSDMARSIGSTLKQLHQPGMCHGVHSAHFGDMSLGDLSKNLGLSWGWLDKKNSSW